MKYRVTLIKREVYEIDDAKNEEDAVYKALDLVDKDMFAFYDPVDEFITERIED